MKEKILWTPNPGPQTQVLSLPDTVFEILYGGARGGGKTDAGIVKPLRKVHNPRYRGLVIRRNAKDLSDWIDRASRMYAGQAELISSEFRFRSGAKILMGHLNDENAYTQYQGHEYHDIIIEELTQIPSLRSYLDLISSARSTVDGIRAQVFATANPGGPGHKWVKEHFRIGQKELWNKIWRDPQSGTLRTYVPAKVEDNPVLVQKNPEYVKWLEALPPERRKAWREGSWDDPEIEGAYFTAELLNARMKGHISPDFAHDKRFPVYTWWDMGRDKTCIGFFQKRGNTWIVIDYYEATAENLAHFAQVIKQKAILNQYYYEKHFAPHDFDREIYDTDQTRIDNARKLGLIFEIVPKLSKEEQIEALRLRFSTLRFNKAACEDAKPPKHSLLDGLTAYRKEYDEDKDEYKPKPVHDWASHPADMMELWAVTPDYMVKTENYTQEWRSEVTHFT